MRYLIEFGRDPFLARQELYNYLESARIDYTILDQGRQVIILDAPSLPPSLIDDLGGTTRIAHVICEAKRADELEAELQKQSIYTGTKNKVEYYITSYHSNYTTFFIDWLKDYFKSIKVKALQKKDPTPTKLKKKTEALDFILYKNFIARTITVTNPQALKQRDLGRPSVDYMRVISIRLAKILINLSMVKKNETLLDCFCGSGTIIQEALLKNINAIGSDQETDAIRQTQKNLTWLQKSYHPHATFKLYTINATNLSKVLPPSSVDAVVTEPYLGPYLRRLPTFSEARETIIELTILYTSLFRELANVLKKGKHAVIILPLFKTLEGKTIRLHTQQLIAATPFTIQTTIPYMPPKSKIGREILVLRKA